MIYIQDYNVVVHQSNALDSIKHNYLKNISIKINEPKMGKNYLHFSHPS